MQHALSGLESNCKRPGAALGRPPCAPAPGPVKTHRRHSRRAFTCRAAGSNGKPPVKVQLKIPYRVNFGQTIGVVGAGEVLGHWDGKKAVRMTWTEGDVWMAEFTVEPGSCAQLEYKYVVINSDGKVCCWKPGQNYKLDILAAKGTKLVVEETWDDGPRHVEVDVQGSEGNTVEIKTGTSVIAQEAQSAMGELKEALERQVNTLQRVSDTIHGASTQLAEFAQLREEVAELVGVLQTSRDSDEEAYDRYYEDEYASEEGEEEEEQQQQQQQQAGAGQQQGVRASSPGVTQQPRQQWTPTARRGTPQAQRRQPTPSPHRSRSPSSPSSTTPARTINASPEREVIYAAEAAAKLIAAGASPRARRSSSPAAVRYSDSTGSNGSSSERKIAEPVVAILAGSTVNSPAPTGSSTTTKGCAAIGVLYLRPLVQYEAMRAAQRGGQSSRGLAGYAGASSASSSSLPDCVQLTGVSEGDGQWTRIDAAACITPAEFVAAAGMQEAACTEWRRQLHVVEGGQVRGTLGELLQVELAAQAAADNSAPVSARTGARAQAATPSLSRR